MRSDTIMIGFFIAVGLFVGLPALVYALIENQGISGTIGIVGFLAFLGIASLIIAKVLAKKWPQHFD